MRASAAKGKGRARGRLYQARARRCRCASCTRSQKGALSRFRIETATKQATMTPARKTATMLSRA